MESQDISHQSYSRKRILRLVAIMVTVALAVAGVSIWVLYQASFEEVRSRLADAARSQARLVEAIDRFNTDNWNKEQGGDPFKATLGILADAHSHNPGIGRTGEFVMAQRQGDQIVFLLGRRHFGPEQQKPVAWNETIAEPMRRALLGDSGTIVAKDYRGTMVLAAFESVAFTNTGIVAKIDLSEIRTPFVQAGLVSLLGAVALVLIGVVLFRHVSAPILEAERNAAALAESERRMLTYFSSCPWGITITDTEGRYQFMNEAYERLMGISGAGLIGRTVDDHRTGDIAEIVRAHDRRVVETGETISEIREPDPAQPNLLEYVSTKFPIRDADGRIVGIGGYMTDVSELRRAESALRESENRLTAIFENMPYGFSLKGIDGRYQLVNEPLAEWFGLSADELIGKTIAEVATLPSHAAELMRLEKRIVENGEVSTTEVSRTAPDGKREFLIVLKFPTRSDNGDVTGIGTIAIDITRQKLAEESLRWSESRLRDFAGSASDWLWETNENHRFFYLSDRFFMATGIPIDSVLGKTRYEVMSGETAESEIWEKHWADLEAHRPFRDFVYHSARPDGTMIWYSISGVPVFDENGVFVGYRGSGSNITKRVQAEKRLRDGQELTQGLLDHIPAMIGLQAPDGKFLLVNRSFERWTTVEKKDVNSEAAKAVWPGPHAVEFDERRHSVVNDDRPLVYETAIAYPDGIQRDIRAVQFPVHNENGSLLGIGFVNMDISDIRRSQEKLRETSAQLRAIVDNAPGSIALTDLDNRFVLVNRALAASYDMDASELIGKPVQEVLSPDQWREGQAHKREVMEKRAAVLKDRMDVFPSGKPNNRLSIKFPVMDSSGEIAAFGTINIDDTDRRNAEEALRKNERLLRSIFDNSPSGITMKGLDGRYHLISRHISEWYGLSGNHLQKTTANDLFPGAIASWIAARDPDIIARNETLVEETEHMFADGTLHKVVVSKFPVPGPDGKPVGIGSIITDVTEQRRSEEQLRQAQKMEVVGQLTGGVAHDFNNLLGVVIGNLDYLKSIVTGDSRSSKLVENAMKAAQSGAELNRRLLAFSRKQPLAPALLELNDHVAGMFDILQRSLGENIEIRVKYCETLWPCIADRAQVESALLNLSINARDAMPDGGVLTIETNNIQTGGDATQPTPNLTPGQYVELSVTDTGTGMAPEVLEHAFEPFFTTKDVGKGSGLGLSMVFGFARQSGGDVSVRSAPGEGTTMSLYLPHTAPAENVVDQPTHTGEPLSRGETVLVVEDNTGLMAICTSFLQDLGYKTITAVDGDAAIAVIEGDSNVDLLLSDVVLPGRMNGLEVAQAFIRRHPDGKVLYMSGNTQNALKSPDPFGHAGVLLRKPFTKAELAQRLRDVLDSTQAARTVVA